MAFRMEDISKRLIDEAIDGLGLWGMGKALEYVKPYTVKTLKQYNDPALKVGLSLIDLVLPQVKNIPYLGDWLGLLGRDGVRDLVKLVIDKPPLCWAEDANTIKCIHFDTTSVTVKIDGTAVTPSGISGTADEFTISLASPLTSGAHDLLVAGNKVSFSGKIYV